MHFERILQAELPFMLSVESGSYTVLLDGSSYDLEILQKQLGVPVRTGGQVGLRIGTAEELIKQIGIDAFNSSFHLELRTIVRHKDAFEVEPSALPAPSESEIIEEIQGRMVRDGSAHGKSGADLEALAKASLSNLDASARSQLAELISMRLFANRSFPKIDAERFRSAINYFVRQYMVMFNDMFAEEVTLHHLGGTSTRGVHIQIACDGLSLENYHWIGKAPPILKMPWFVPSSQQLASFRSALSSGVDPDPVALLSVRARALLERGANRSAIIEAAAALDLTIARKVRDSLARQGLISQDIDDLLKNNQRFPDRAKTLMKKATGVSAAEIDQQLWERVTKSRDQYRHKVAHSDKEARKNKCSTRSVECLNSAGG